jgi:hypothetical protein
MINSYRKRNLISASVLVFFFIVAAGALDTGTSSSSEEKEGKKYKNSEKTDVRIRKNRSVGREFKSTSHMGDHYKCRREGAPWRSWSRKNAQ